MSFAHGTVKKKSNLKLKVIKHYFSIGVPVITIPCHVNCRKTVAMRGGRGPGPNVPLWRNVITDKVIKSTL